MTVKTNKRRRIAHVVRQYFPSVGGLETYVHELAVRQADTHRVYIVTLNRVFGSPELLPAMERSGRVVILRIPYKGVREFFVPFLPLRLLRKFSLVHIHATDQLLDTIAVASRVLGTPYVVTTHGLFFHTERFARIKKVYLRLITRFSLRRARTVFAVSDNDRQTVRKVGVEAALLRNPIVPLGDFISEGRDLIYIGRIAPNKRIDKLIEFAQAAMEQDPDLHLHIVGGDPDGLWEGLSRGLQRSPAADRIRYHGYLSPDALRPLLHRCGYIVSASRYEGYGLSMIEGMSVGLLPVMHDNAAFRETYALSGAGIILDFDEPRQAARGFLEWRDSVGSGERRKAAAYAHAQSWDSVVRRVEESYGSALSTPR